MVKSKEVISMSMRELKRLHVIQKVIEKGIKQKKAAQLLNLSIRQIKRLVKRIRKEDEKGMIHRLRGHVSNRKYPEKLKEKVIRLYEKSYPDFGPTLAQEKLLERDNIQISRETLRQWLLGERLWQIQRKHQAHFEWRERKACFGEMTQIDGSHHDWLEGRCPKLVLMGYIDDATSEVFARFYDYEGTMPAMDSFYRYTKQYGLPHSVYLDRLSAYRGGYGKLSLEDELNGLECKRSQFERALEELGVKVIHAQSPQAKGRIERLFRTFQDRLIKEMRLAGIKTKEEANRFLKTYLPKYNRRFSVKAREEANLHLYPPRDRELVQILSIQEKRVIRNDHTIRHGKQLYQLINPKNSAKEVIAQERMDGKLYLVQEGRTLQYCKLKEPPRKNAPKKTSYPLCTRKKHSQPNRHPWKERSYLNVMAKKAHLNQDSSLLNVFKQTIPTKDKPYPPPNLTYQQNQHLKQKEERTKEEKELLLIHS